MKVLVGCPVKNREWCISKWLDAIESQELDLGVVVETACVVTPSEDATEQILRSRGVHIIPDERPGRTDYQMDHHLWPADIFNYMAEIRNLLIEEALTRNVDYFFSLDSDILLPQNGLQLLLDYSQGHPGVISPAVNMQWRAKAWNTMQWSDPHRPATAVRNRSEPPDGQADVVMAAMLLDRKGLECRWEAHHQGEDIGFCLDAEAKSISRWWYPQVKCDHLMYR